MAPGQRAEADALRNAFGADYEAQLRKEAGERAGRASRAGSQCPAAVWLRICLLVCLPAEPPLAASHPPSAAPPRTPPAAAAGAAEPSKLAKRRHQISSLYSYAKAKELEQLEVRAAGVKSKAETAKKYGW